MCVCATHSSPHSFPDDFEEVSFSCVLFRSPQTLDCVSFFLFQPCRISFDFFPTDINNRAPKPLFPSSNPSALPMAIKQQHRAESLCPQGERSESKSRNLYSATVFTVSGVGGGNKNARKHITFMLALPTCARRFEFSDANRALMVTMMIIGNVVTWSHHGYTPFILFVQHSSSSSGSSIMRGTMRQGTDFVVMGKRYSGKCLSGKGAEKNNNNHDDDGIKHTFKPCSHRETGIYLKEPQQGTLKKRKKPW